MVQKIWKQILENTEVRQNLSKLREVIKDNGNKEKCRRHHYRACRKTRYHDSTGIAENYYRRPSGYPKSRS